MTGLSLALANLKPGTGKTTSAVWLAHVFAQAGNRVLLVDADPAGSALEWSDLAAMDPHLAAPEAAFPFRIVALPSRELHRRVPEIAQADDVVIIDAPQLEDHAGIARSALRYADEILIPCAPSPIEINRTTPVRDEIAEISSIREQPARSAVLLNRCIARAHSTVDAREALENLGYDVLDTAVPRREVYAQSFGMPIKQTGSDIWRQVARDLVDRHVRLLACAARGLCGAGRGGVWLARGRGGVWLACVAGVSAGWVRAGRLCGFALGWRVVPVAVASVAHAAGGAVKLAIIVVDSGLVVVLVHYRPPNPPRSPNPPRKS